MNTINKSDFPKVYGLVLAGGQSTRMGMDKGTIQLEGKDLRVHLYDLLNPLVANCYISIRNEQSENLEDTPYLSDKVLDHGPFGALMTAFMHEPDAAWLIVGCDQALITTATFEQLLTQRDATKLATVFNNSSKDFPNPLPALWEPAAFDLLIDALSQGKDSMMKILLASDINRIDPLDDNWLFNMNTVEDAKKIKLL